MRLPSGVTVPDDSRTAAVRGWFSPLNLHLAAAVLLVLLNVFLAARLYLLHSSAGLQGGEAVVNAQTRVAGAEIAARRLRGVDLALSQSDAEARSFYTDRLPFAYSDVAAQLGLLAGRTNVRLSRAQYVQAAPADDVTELRIDASVTGQYRDVARFLNSLERNRSFFLVESLGLSGAQGGLVNLRLRIGTYLREPMPGYATAQAVNGAQP